MNDTDTNDLCSYFDEETLRSGTADFRRRQVVSLAWQDKHTLVGRVSGSRKQVHTVEVEFDDDHSEICWAECTCNEEFDCRHAAAVLLSFLDNPSAVKPPPAESSSPVSKSSPARSRSNIADDLKDLLQRDLLSEIADVMAGLGVGTRPPRASMADTASSIPPEWLKLDPALEHGLDQLQLAMARFRSSNGSCSKDHWESGREADSRSRILYVVSAGEYGSYPSLDLLNVAVKRDGTYGQERRMGLHDLDRCAVAAPDDYAIARLWRCLKWWELEDSDPSREAPDDFAHCFALLMDRILSTGRCHFETKNGPLLHKGPELPGKFVWHPVGDKQLRLHVVAMSGEGQYDCMPWRCPWYCNQDTNEFGPVKLGYPEQVVAAALRVKPIDRQQAVGFACALADRGLVEAVPLPPTDSQNIEVHLVQVKPKLAVNSLTDRTASAGSKTAQRALLLSFPPPFITDKIRKIGGKTIVEKQDRRLDRLFIEQVKELGFRDITEHVDGTDLNEYFFLAEDPLRWADFDDRAIRELRSQGFDVSKQTEQLLRPIHVSDSDFRFEIKGDSQWWYSMELHVEAEGRKISLFPIIKSALRRLPEVSRDAVESLNHNGSFVAILDNGEVVSLPFERIRTIILALQELLESDKDADTDAIKVSALHAAQLLEEKNFLNARLHGAENLFKFINQLSQLKDIQQVPQPRDFQATLRHYQLQGVSWLQFLARLNLGGILADDMGLGKTVQLLAHICLEKESGRLKSPFLVVCPTSVVPNWCKEIQRFAPGLKAIAYVGQDRAAHLGQLSECDLVVTSYPLLTRDLQQLKRITWHGIALDEAQMIKNPQAKVAESAKKLGAGHKFCLTGTPVENHLGELWSQFDFLVPGLLSDKASFKRCIQTPIEKYGNTDLQLALAARIRPFVLRRAKSQVLTELPEKTEIVKHVELSGQQLDLYETVRLACDAEIRAEIAKKGFNASQIIILKALLQLRQVCCDPRLVKLEAAGTMKESAKLDVLMEMIEQLLSEQRKILVFSQFTSMLDLIGAELLGKGIEYVELRGDTRDRVTPVEKFQNTEITVFLISLKAGGLGLNLTAADVVIHYDPWWNPAVEDQATDRAHRIGQDKHVFVYKLVAHGTIEQRLLALQEKKRSLAASIYDAKGNLGSAFTEEDLANLLSPIESLS